MTQGGSARRRIALSVTDQALSSLTNILSVGFAAYLLAPSAFGIFALAYTGLTLAIGLIRVSVGQPLLLITADSEENQQGAVEPRSVALLSLTVAVGTSLTVSLLLLLMGAQPLMAFAFLVGITAILIQDVLRHVAISQRQVQLALASDALWCGLLVSGFLIHRLRINSPAEALLLWLLAGTVSLVPLLPLLLYAPRLRHPIAASLKALWPAGRRLAVEFVAVTASGQVVLLAVGALLEPAAAGALRGGFSLFGPLNVLFAAVTLAVTPELRRRWVTGALQGGRQLAAANAAIVVTTTAALGGLAVSPLGANALDLLGETGLGILVVAPALAVRYVATAIITCLGVYVRSLGQLGMSMRLQLVAAPGQAIAAIAACASGNVVLVAWTLAAMEAITAIVFVYIVQQQRPSLAAYDSP